MPCEDGVDKRFAASLAACCCSVGEVNNVLAAPAEPNCANGDCGAFVLSHLFEEAENARVGSPETVDDGEWDHAGSAFEDPIARQTGREQEFFMWWVSGECLAYGLENTAWRLLQSFKLGIASIMSRAIALPMRR